MTVNSHNVEFGYELISVIPYAYYLHRTGRLEKTISGHDTEPLYYFSPCHEINPEPRSWYNLDKLTTPNRDIHKPHLDVAQFITPPYREIYSGKYNFDLIICNRYNNEWPLKINKPLNYFSLDWLRRFFEANQDKSIGYINIHGFEKYYDDAPALDLGDYELCKQFGNVSHVRDLYSGGSLNQLQLEMMAGCSEFFTLNGGYSILASYFGGVNHIYINPYLAKDGRYRPHEFTTGDFGYYHFFSGSKIDVKINQSI